MTELVTRANEVEPVGSRYSTVTAAKATGATYSPKVLADFLAAQIVSALSLRSRRPLKILDPAVGNGELLLSLLETLGSARAVEVVGYELDCAALKTAQRRIAKAFPKAAVRLVCADFLQHALRQNQAVETFDVIIANPPYVRAHILGAEQVRMLSRQLGLSGRMDLSHAFLVVMARALRPGGTAGFIVSNRFMSIKSGAAIRQILREKLKLLHVWDLGDTKVFDAAVLPAVLLATTRGTRGESSQARFTSIYSTRSGEPERVASDALEALSHEGDVALRDGRRFSVRQGVLADDRRHGGVWRIANEQTEAWLGTVMRHCWGCFADIGPVRVGVMTSANSIFIRDDWHTLPSNERPELLRPIITHHIAQRYHAAMPEHSRQILYPHESKDGQRRAVDLKHFPKSRRYLQAHRKELGRRRYLLAAGRKWYELWVARDPAAWSAPKLVFPDIAEQPIFSMDCDGCVVNSDCYWLAADTPKKEPLLWLALGVANSTFVECFYDRRFNNKLYAGRRRFITQYVERFPLPRPDSAEAKAIMTLVKRVHRNPHAKSAVTNTKMIDALVWKSFGLTPDCAK